MTKKLKYLAIIPARGGSKGIPRKNMVPIAGKPLIAYTIEAALKSDCLDKVVVSSDSPEIMEFAQCLGINESYQRPTEVSTDFTPMAETLKDVIFHYEKEGYEIENIMLLQPTSPLRTAEDIRGAVECFNSTDKKSLIGVTPAAEHPCEIIEQTPEKDWSFLVHAKGATRRQDYKNNYWFLSGAMYICNKDHFLETNIMFHPGESLLFPMPEESRIDIDSLADLELANFYLSQRNG